MKLHKIALFFVLSGSISLHAIPFLQRGKNLLGLAAAHLSRKNPSLNNQRLLSQKSFKPGSFEAMQRDFPHAAQKVQDIFAARNQNTKSFEFFCKGENMWNIVSLPLNVFHYSQKFMQEIDDTLKKQSDVLTSVLPLNETLRWGIETKQEQVFLFYARVGYYLECSINVSQWLELLAIDNDNIRFNKQVDFVHKVYTNMYGAKNPEIPEILKVLLKYYMHQHELSKDLYEAQSLITPKELEPLTSLGRAKFISNLIKQKTKK